MVANLLYYLAVIVCILVAAITCLIFGVRLLRLLGTYQSTKQLDSAAAKFLQRVRGTCTSVLTCFDMLVRLIIFSPAAYMVSLLADCGYDHLGAVDCPVCNWSCEH